MKSNKPVIIWLYVGAMLVASMVIVGGVTRLTNSGLSMVEWKLILGAVPPGTDSEWQQAFEKYQQFPEYNLINTDFTLDDFKSIYWWEYSHRLLGRIIGLVFLLPFLFFLIRGYLDRKLIVRLVILFSLGGLQGFLGWYMVKSGLIDQPDVSHYRLAIHLLAAIIVLSYIIWLIMSLTNRKINKVRSQLFYKTMWFLYFLLLLQLVYGAFVAGLNAGKFHTTFPLVDGEWIPGLISTALTEHGWSSLVANVTTVQFIHRWVGLSLTFAIVAVYYVFSPSLLPLARNRFRALMSAVLVQATLGILTLLMAAPFFLAIIHQFMAIILVVVMVVNLYGAKPGFPERA